jgi:hypothetical protein
MMLDFTISSCLHSNRVEFFYARMQWLLAGPSLARDSAASLLFCMDLSRLMMHRIYH